AAAADLRVDAVGDQVLVEVDAGVIGHGQPIEVDPLTLGLDQDLRRAMDDSVLGLVQDLQDGLFAFAVDYVVVVGLHGKPGLLDVAASHGDADAGHAPLELAGHPLGRLFAAVVDGEADDVRLHRLDLDDRPLQHRLEDGVDVAQVRVA